MISDNNKYSVDSSIEFWNLFLEKCLEENNAEASMSVVTKTILDILGDKTAHLKPGGLKEGENQYSVSAAVMISKTKEFNIFVAQQNFPSSKYA